MRLPGAIRNLIRIISLQSSRCGFVRRACRVIKRRAKGACGLNRGIHIHMDSTSGLLQAVGFRLTWCLRRYNWGE